ncbi:unnamed protein product [Cuscuta epithymum]|uniref:Uncharacterized protein n=1 Tax=Cuscuta epithymum TaxID=186058 RepID=A0AAV0G2R6_9ASTE|nr:unnamed protein product [Cuscuta epithymum]
MNPLINDIPTYGKGNKEDVFLVRDPPRGLRDGARWVGERELSLHGGRLHGSDDRRAGPEKPGGAVKLRRRDRRGEKTGVVRDLLLQLLPLVFSSGPRAETRHYSAEQHRCGSGLQGPCESQGLAGWDDGLCWWVRLGLRLLASVYGQSDRDPVGDFFVWERNHS